MEVTPAPALPFVHHEALLIASWPPLPGHVLDAGRQPVSVVVPSVPLKLYLRPNVSIRSLRCTLKCLLFVEHNATSSAVGEPSLQLCNARWDRTGSTSTARRRRSEALRFANNGVGRALLELGTVANGGSVHSCNSASKCKSRELHGVVGV